MNPCISLVGKVLGLFCWWFSSDLHPYFFCSFLLEFYHLDIGPFGPVIYLSSSPLILSLFCFLGDILNFFLHSFCFIFKISIIIILICKLFFFFPHCLVSLSLRIVTIFLEVFFSLCGLCFLLTSFKVCFCLHISRYRLSSSSSFWLLVVSSCLRVNEALWNGLEISSAWVGLPTLGFRVEQCSVLLASGGRIPGKLLFIPHAQGSPTQQRLILPEMSVVLAEKSCVSHQAI